MNVLLRHFIFTDYFLSTYADTLYGTLSANDKNRLSHQELLADGIEIIDCPHTIGRFCGRSYVNPQVLQDGVYRMLICIYHSSSSLLE